MRSVVFSSEEGGWRRYRPPNLNLRYWARKSFGVCMMLSVTRSRRRERKKQESTQKHKAHLHPRQLRIPSKTESHSSFTTWSSTPTVVSSQCFLPIFGGRNWHFRGTRTTALPPLALCGAGDSLEAAAWAYRSQSPAVNQRQRTKRSRTVCCPIGPVWPKPQVARRQDRRIRLRYLECCLCYCHLQGQYFRHLYLHPLRRPLCHRHRLHSDSEVPRENRRLSRRVRKLQTTGHGETWEHPQLHEAVRTRRAWGDLGIAETITVIRHYHRRRNLHCRNFLPRHLLPRLPHHLQHIGGVWRRMTLKAQSYLVCMRQRKHHRVTWQRVYLDHEWWALNLCQQFPRNYTTIEIRFTSDW